MLKYSINIKLSESTLKQLRSANKVLYAFNKKGISASSSAGATSTVWFTLDSLHENINLTWEVGYDVNISDIKSIDIGTKIISSTTRRTMEAGGTVNVDDANTIDMDKTKGIPTFCGINNNNNGEKPHTCGLSHQNPRCELVTICATILNGHFNVGIEPTEKVYLVFSDALHQEDVVLIQSTGPGYVIDVTDPSMSGVKVAFDINLGWSCANADHRSNCVPVRSGLAFVMS
jgi:hypothetical protein